MCVYDSYFVATPCSLYKFARVLASTASILDFIIHRNASWKHIWGMSVHLCPTLPLEQKHSSTANGIECWALIDQPLGLLWGLLVRSGIRITHQVRWVNRRWKWMSIVPVRACPKSIHGELELAWPIDWLAPHHCSRLLVQLAWPQVLAWTVLHWNQCKKHVPSTHVFAKQSNAWAQVVQWLEEWNHIHARQCWKVECSFHWVKK